ncbi:hypothetical protein GCM10009846_30900 [Agrococcus versicolor]|uniref:Uncharacterized protein n=1 Tax=Agrococcus versicolor TaxID=501482 RepID=A0ABP5MPM1_9MICO
MTALAGRSAVLVTVLGGSYGARRHPQGGLGPLDRLAAAEQHAADAGLRLARSLASRAA